MATQTDSITEPTALETSYARICHEHNLTAITVGFNLKQADASRFDVIAHWDGFSRTPTSCVIEHGPTIQAAMAAALDKAAEERKPLGFYPQLEQDEALIENAPRVSVSA